MVRAWYYVDSDGDRRDPHMADPPRFLSLEELNEKTGVEYFEYDAATWETNQEFANLKKTRGHTYDDIMEISRDALPNYDEMIEAFYTEHIHSDDEIRYVEAGSGYFDVRDKNDRWIRVEVKQSDLLIVPAGLYHRFTLDTINQYIKLRRYFIGQPEWAAINRPMAEEHPTRKQYVQRMAVTAN